MPFLLFLFLRKTLTIILWSDECGLTRELRQFSVINPAIESNDLLQTLQNHTLSEIQVFFGGIVCSWKEQRLRVRKPVFESSLCCT